MKKKLAGMIMRQRKPLLVLGVVALSFGCRKSNDNQKELRDFTQVNLVANTREYNPRFIDQTLINGFGIAWSPNGIAWVNSVGGHVSELYDAEGVRKRAVNIPSPTDSVGGFPCGIVFSGDRNFKLSNHNPALFLFTSFDGVLSGWNGGNNAEFIKAPAKASYTGLAIASSNGQNFIYAANFGQKKIDVWDSAFKLVRNMPFKDPSVPSDFSPYNIQAVGDWLFVMYAQLGADGHGVAGAGNGYVSIFNTDGSLVRTFAARGTLNVPWGVTMAPASFLDDKDMGDGSGHGGYGTQSNSVTVNRRGQHDPVILVGNFGDGRINVFTQDGNFLGQLQTHNHTLVIEGLWALTFPPASAGIDPARLYFSAGPDAENDGVFGYLIKQ